MTSTVSILDALEAHQPATIAGLVELVGKSETTVRKAIKTYVADGIVELVPESKPATYRLITPEWEAPVSTELVVIAKPSTELAVIEPEVIDAEVVEDDEPEPDLDALIAAIASPAPPTKKTRKVATTKVDGDMNRLVSFNGQVMTVTDAFPYAVDAPPLQSVDMAYTIAESADHRLTFDALLLQLPADEAEKLLSDGWDEPTDIRPATAVEIAAVYFVTVQAQLDVMYTLGQITYPVWYGRSCRLQHLVIGHGRGTGDRKPAVETTED